MTAPENCFDAVSIKTSKNFFLHFHQLLEIINDHKIKYIKFIFPYKKQQKFVAFMNNKASSLSNPFLSASCTVTIHTTTRC